MKKFLLIFVLAVGALSQSGCKIIKNKPASESAIPADQTGDDARNKIRLEETFEAEFLPHVEQNAVPITELQAQIASDFDATATAHGNRGSGQGAAWNFPIKGAGKIVTAKLDTRARTIGVDTNADGAADVTLQVGPVIRGTALRDAAPFYNFDDFRDQIEFAKLSRALNDRIKATLIVPEGDLIGKTVEFVGVIPLKSADQDLVTTPIKVLFSE